MATRSDAKILRLGAVSIVVLLLSLAAAFNLQKFPGFAGTTYHAEFVDASGLHVGSEVQVAGIRVGRVKDIRIDSTKVIVDFDVKGADLGNESTAQVQVQNLLGEKFLHLTSVGDSKLPSDGTIPVDRTDVTFDIVGTLGQLTTQTEDTQKKNLSEALTTLAEVIDQAAPEVQSSFRGISRLSNTISSRDKEISDLLESSANVTALLDERKSDLITLMDNANLVFIELRQRKRAIHNLLVKVEQLAIDLDGLVQDNKEQLKPTLDRLDEVLSFLKEREQKLQTLLHNYGPYVNILGNIVGTGPWFDAYIPNITGVFSGEFVPGKR